MEEEKSCTTSRKVCQACRCASALLPTCANLLSEQAGGVWTRRKGGNSRPDTNLIIKTASRKKAGQSKNSNSAAFKLQTVAVIYLQNFTFFCFRLCFHEVSLIDYFPLEAVIIMISEGNDLRSRSSLYLLWINWRDHRVAYLSGTTNKENFGFKNVLDCVF